MDEGLVCLLGCAIFITICEASSLSSLVHYQRIPEQTGKRCSSTDLVFNKTISTPAICAALPIVIAECRSVFYQQETHTCYGCADFYDQYNSSVSLVAEAGTEYYCPVLCPTDWSRYGDSCYMFGEERLSWENALIDCQTERASLVEVNDADENDFVQSLASDSEVWIGFNDHAQDGEFKWGDSNDTVTYRNWESVEPNGGTRENCVFFHNQMWADYPCSIPFNYVCEKAATGM